MYCSVQEGNKELYIVIDQIFTLDDKGKKNNTNDMNLIKIALEVTTNFTIDKQRESYQTQEDDLSMTGVDLESTTLYKVARVLWKVVPPVILVCGTFGNSMILIILHRASLGGSSHSMSIFFSALAVSDLLLLYTGLLRQWLFYVMTIQLRELHDSVCKLHTFFVYLIGMTSAWFLVCMTTLRVMSVVWPLRIDLLCTRRKTTVTVVLVVIFLATINAHILGAYTLQEGSSSNENISNNVTANSELSCIAGESPGLEYYDTFVFPWIDLMFTSCLPSLILFVGNSILVTSVARSTRQVRHLAASPPKQRRARQKAASSLTVTLISVSVTFLLLTLPLSVDIIVRKYAGAVTTGGSGDRSYEAKMELSWAVCNLLWYSNSAVNFYVYCLTGRRFRARCRRLLTGCCGSLRQGGGNTASSASVFVLTLNQRAREKKSTRSY